MHRAASRFSRTAQEAAVKADMMPVLDDFSTLLRQCVACHDAYRIR
jgi:cytochrome c556